MAGARELGVAAAGARGNPALRLDRGELVEPAGGQLGARQEPPVEIAMLGQMLFEEAVLLERRAARPPLASGRCQIEGKTFGDEAVEHRPAAAPRGGELRAGYRIAVITRPHPQAVD